MEVFPFTVKPREDTGLYNAKVGIWLFLASEVMLFGALFSSYILLRVGAAPETWPHGLLSVPLGMLNTIVLIASSVTVVLSWAALKMNQFSRYKVFQGITLLCALTFLVVKAFEYSDKFGHYEVWKTDGGRMTGHIEGHPYFWTLATLKAKNLEAIKFSPDATHYKDSTWGRRSEAKAHQAGEPAAPGGGHHEAIEIKTADIKRLSAFVPSHGIYFALYFTLTGLHALHVIGGVIVIGAIWGPFAKLWKTDPDRYTNRVEVSGLFWHFVDLVWIFLFPILYLL